MRAGQGARAAACSEPALPLLCVHLDYGNRQGVVQLRAKQWLKNPHTNAPRRDEALAAIEDAIRQQGEQERAIETEVAGYKRDIAKQQVGDGVGICLWVLCACAGTSQVADCFYVWLTFVCNCHPFLRLPTSSWAPSRARWRARRTSCRDR